MDSLAAFFRLVRELAFRGRLRCLSCGRPMEPVVSFYEHRDGVILDGTVVRVWPYVECHGCGYQNSFVKLRRLERHVKYASLG